MCLKTENCYLKIFVEIRVNEKSVLKCVQYCLKTENSCLKSQTKHPLSFLEKENLKTKVLNLSKKFYL